MIIASLNSCNSSTIPEEKIYTKNHLVDYVQAQIKAVEAKKKFNPGPDSPLHELHVKILNSTAFPFLNIKTNMGLSEDDVCHEDLHRLKTLLSITKNEKKLKRLFKKIDYFISDRAECINLSKTRLFDKKETCLILSLLEQKEITDIDILKTLSEKIKQLDKKLPFFIDAKEGDLIFYNASKRMSF